VKRAPAVPRLPAAAPPQAVATLAPAAATAGVAAGMPQRIGAMTHYYPHVDAGVIEIEAGELRVGDTIHVRGHTTDYYQRVDRIEVDHEAVEVARSGQSVGVHVTQRVREGDDVWKVSSG
jgi:putative protease